MNEVVSTHKPLFVDHEPSESSVLGYRLVAASFFVAAALGVYMDVKAELHTPDTTTVVSDMHLDRVQTTVLNDWVTTSQSEARRAGIISLIGFAGGGVTGLLSLQEARLLRKSKKLPEQIA